MKSAWSAAWAIMFMLALFVLILSTAQSNGLIVFQGDSVDLAAILLSAVSVLVTILGVFIAIMALWGYKEIRDRAIETAVQRAVSAASRTAADVAVPVARRTALSYLKSKRGDADGSSDEEVNEIAQAVEPEEDANETH